MSFDYGPLVDHLRQGSLIAFLGAGLSRPFTDPISKVTQPGFLSASELVEKWSQSRTYLDTHLSFPEACFLIKIKESRPGLERLLLEEFDKPPIKQLPAHRLAATLPFSAYVTTNYDTLLEKALAATKRSPLPVLRDEDVSRLRSTSTLVAKLHGCITQPGTMIAAADEYVPLGERAPIIESLLRVHLANKTVLFLGFSLSDYDFTALYAEVKSILGTHMPQSYAVVKEADEYRKNYWTAKGVTLVEGDLTEFLRGLLRATTEAPPPAVSDPLDDWFNNTFFESLHRIRSLPSETQVIDAFLSHLLQEVQTPSLLLPDILLQAEKAVKSVLARRPNFHGLHRLGETLLPDLHSRCANSDDAELLLKELMNKRSLIGRGISNHLGLIRRSDNVLLYSQSVRVLQLLEAVPHGIQDTCKLFIAECRPKSPDSFQDALAIAEALIRTGYEITLIPDMAIENLLGRHQISKVLLGAHAVFMLNGSPLAFVNTNGSGSIMRSAEAHHVPVYIVADSEKLVEVPSANSLPPISFDEEERVFAGISATLTERVTQGQRLGTHNIGYDLCHFGHGGTLLTEARKYDPV